MESLIFSLNATIPIFLVMLFGYSIKNTKLVNPTFTSMLNTFNYKVTLPVLLFYDLANADFKSVWNTKYVLYCFFVTLICILVTWLVSWLILRWKPTTKTLIGEFVQASYRGSAAVLGIAFIQNIYGVSIIGPLMILGTVPLYNFMAVVILIFTDPTNSHVDAKTIKKSLIGILTNPMIISIFLGLIMSLLPINIPVMINKTLAMIAQLASPLALIALGASIEGRKAISMIRPTIFTVMIKLIIQPLIFLPVAVSFGFRGEQLVALLVMLGAPTTVSSFIMAKNMNHEGVLTSSAVVASTFLSSITMTFWIYWLRSRGLI